MKQKDKKKNKELEDAKDIKNRAKEKEGAGKKLNRKTGQIKELFCFI
jgi:hypothetical protein